MTLRTSIALLALTAPVLSQTRPAVIVTVKNNAPELGTFQTPVWIGFHDGNFDTYNSGALASSLPFQGSDAIERIAEDGAVGPLNGAFSQLQPLGVQSVMASNDPNLPVHAPGRQVSRLFELDPTLTPYFSYASMVIPSNDAFISNGNPTAHPIFDNAGGFVGVPFKVLGNEVLDAGTELNDEAPSNTAFFGQMAPNTGMMTTNRIGLHSGFMAPGSGGILDSAMFANADFLAPGYEAMEVSFTTINRGTRVRRFARLNGANETTPNQSLATGGVRAEVSGAADRIRVIMFADRLEGQATGAHLHLGLDGQDGPVCLDLSDSIIPVGPDSVLIFRHFDASDLQGALAGDGDPIGALMAELATGNVYFNLHTDAYPMGEVRGQL